MNIKDYLECPMCRTKRLRKSVERNPKFGKEYFCDRCHVYFGVYELAHEWGWDAADFISDNFNYPDALIWERIKMAVACGPRPFVNEFQNFNGLFWWKEYDEMDVPDGEGEWSSWSARWESYEVVNNMWMGVDEWLDGCGNDPTIHFDVLGY